jgi:hypothetical protein
MDIAKRTQLIDAIRRQGLPSEDAPLPIVAMEEFFEGNDDRGSIGCNLMEHPGIGCFFETLRSIRDRSDVQDVLIEIYEVEEDDESMWPFSERVFVITQAEPEAVANWFAVLQPSEVETGLPLPPAAPDVQEGSEVYAAWWD